ncbi:sce7725 family protein [Photorhabdus laumondii]|uniref:sce7725 family protein n=1 Tax=Photorhabdus laumondii TaxID=2218628 RepID=UPI0025AEFFE5|nr:sce7725 family protein [Photorhabdus laumondii]
MYSPYLYGRGSELLALRELAESCTNTELFIPIIEPVLTKTDKLIRCLEVLSEKNKRVMLVVNPKQHEFSKDIEARRKFVATIKTNLNKCNTLIPALMVDLSVSIATIDGFLKAFDDTNVALIYNKPSISDMEFSRLTKFKVIEFHITTDGNVTDFQFNEIPKNKLIEVKDNFVKLDKNADYSGQEIFTDKHKKIGKTVLGIGDFTIVGKKLEIGGGKAGAVASHLVYKHPTSGDIWIEHFVSNDTDRDVGDVASKFLQMTDKIEKAVSTRKTEYGSNNALDKYNEHYISRTFPGLGKNKEYQIRHHIQHIIDVISGKI